MKYGDRRKASLIARLKAERNRTNRHVSKQRWTKHRGLLHSKVHVKKNEKIPVAKLEAEKTSAKKRGDTKEEREAQFAINARSWKH